jgi:hypothetical protein
MATTLHYASSDSIQSLGEEWMKMSSNKEEEENASEKTR